MGLDVYSYLVIGLPLSNEDVYDETDTHRGGHGERAKKIPLL